MRRLHPPTFMQWGCDHHWKTTTSRAGENEVIRVRYLTCMHCGLKLKTEERPAVPWGEADLIAQVRELLPEGEPVNLQDHGITELPLEALNARLEPMGYRIHASGRRDATRAVACIDRKGQAIAYTHFELQRFPRERR